MRPLRRHIFLTEVMQPWFFFAYMEAKSFVLGQDLGLPAWRNVADRPHRCCTTMLEIETI